MDESTIIAYEMNGAPLPHLNGAPARLIVPGWTGTYWMKHVVSIKAATTPEKGFWMNPAYRLPLGKFPMVARFVTQETAVNTPITEIMVNSLITSHADGARVRAGTSVGGIAWDGGYGIRTVDVSTDGGKTWRPAALGEDLRLPHLQLSAHGPRQRHRDGARHQCHRPDPDRQPDPQSGRLPPQRHPQRLAGRFVREGSMRTIMMAIAAAAVFALPAGAQEKPVSLKKGPGLDKVEANCSGCHSLDYIQMNSPYPSAALWSAEVTKMIKAFGAPISEADAKEIADYLKKNYGS
jgi:hypothetical protein